MSERLITQVYLTSKLNSSEISALEDVLTKVETEESREFQISKNSEQVGKSILDIAKELWPTVKESRGGGEFLVADEHTLQELKDRVPKEKVSFRTVYFEGEDLEMFDELIRTRDIANEKDKDPNMIGLERLEYLMMKFEEWSDERREIIRFESFWDSPSRESQEWNQLKNHFMVKISIARLDLYHADNLLGLCDIKDPNDMFDCSYSEGEVIKH